MALKGTYNLHQKANTEPVTRPVDRRARGGEFASAMLTNGSESAHVLAVTSGTHQKWTREGEVAHEECCMMDDEAESEKQRLGSRRKPRQGVRDEVHI